MIQKIIRIGNSHGITVPKSFLEKSGLKVGDEISVEFEPNSQTVVMTSPQNAKKMQLSPDFILKLEAIKKDYAQAIKELAMV